jgi:glycosyltransferase involved in cell wall biosynthesis
LEWEIVVADDGSTDAASVAANEAINTLPCCRYIIREENVGRAAIRNFLASEAKYEWLLFLDSDVEIRRHDFISQYLNACADYDLVCGRYDLPATSESLLRNLRYRYERSYISCHSASVRNLHPFQSLSTANFLIRRSIMLAHPFNEVIRRYGYEDVLLGKSLALSHARVLHIDNPVTLRSFDTNADYLSKVEASLITLRDIHDDIHGYSLLLHYADLPFVSSIMTFQYFGCSYTKGIYGKGFPSLDNVDAPDTGHSLHPSFLPCSNPCQMKSLAVNPTVNVISGIKDAAARAYIPAVDIPIIPKYELPRLLHFSIAFSTLSMGQLTWL